MVSFSAWCIHQKIGPLWSWMWSATQAGCGVNDAQLVLRGPKCAKKILLTPSYHQQKPWTIDYDRMDPCFHVVMSNYDSKIWMSKQKSRPIKPGNSSPVYYCLILVTCGNCRLSFLFLESLTGVAPSVYFCCCSPSASRFGCVVCSEMLFCRPQRPNACFFFSFFLVAVAFVLYQFEPVWPFSSDLCRFCLQVCPSLDIISFLDHSL